MSQGKKWRRLLLFGTALTTVSCLSGGVPLSLGALLSTASLSGIATVLGSVTAGNVANALDSLTETPSDNLSSLSNQDLTKAVGRAIAAIIALVTENPN